MDVTTSCTIVGNITADPDLRFTTSGQAVANFTVASTARVYDREAGVWKDAENTTFLRCAAWRSVAQNVAETLHKGDRVLVAGRLIQNSYETKEGDKRTSYDLEVDEIGASLRYATAELTRVKRNGGANSDDDQH